MRKAEPVAGAGGLLLLVSLFMTWYDGSVETSGTQTAGAIVSVAFSEASGWEVFSVVDVLLALSALVAIAVPLVSAFTRGPAKSIGIAVIASTITPLALLIVVFRILFPPDVEPVVLGSITARLTLSPGLGAWLSLAGALIAFVGAWMSMRDESTPGAAPPDILRRPVPNITP
jgi:hypothetical protein